MKTRSKIALLGFIISFLFTSWCLPPITLSKKTIETNDSDSLSSVLIHSEHKGMMDTSLCVLEGRISNLNSMTPVKKQLISIKSGFKLHIVKTDSTGYFKFDMIPTGDYRIKISNKKYKPLTIDSLHLQSGEIRALSIGLAEL